MRELKFLSILTNDTNSIRGDNNTSDICQDDTSNIRRSLVEVDSNTSNMQCHMPTSKLLKADQGPNRNTVILSSP